MRANMCKNRPRIRSTSEDIRHGKSWSGVHAIMDLADGPWDGPISVRVRSMGMSMGLPLSARLRVFRSLARVSALRLRESSGCTSSGCSPCVPCTMQKREGVCHHLAPYGMRSAASLSRGELQREVAGHCRTCERRRARMGSRETLRAPPARVGHAHTHTAPGYVTCTCSPKVIAGGSSQRTR